MAVSRARCCDDLPAPRSPIRSRDCTEKPPPGGAIDEGTVYPGRAAAALGEVGAWGSHQPKDGPGRSALRHSIDRGDLAKSAARPPSWRGARTRWSGTPRIQTIRSSHCEIWRQVRHRADPGGTGLSNPMKSFFGIEKLKLRGRKVDGVTSSGAALGIEPRHRPYLRHHLRARGRARAAP